MSEERRTYAGYRLLPAALGILDEEGDPRSATAISRDQAPEQPHPHDDPEQR